MTPADYLALGWAVVPIDPQAKTPVHRDWPAKAAARAFRPEDFEGRNVGVVLGAVSGDLVDVDLDSYAALALAADFLPGPTLTFGRASNRASHWLYRSPGATSEKLWFPAGDGRELVEIRANNVSGGCGHQTVFPGSVHRSGELIEWDDPDAELLEVDAAELRWAVARLAVASSILNGWGEGSGRHEKSLGLAGGLLKAGWNPDEVRHCLMSVRSAAGDSAAEEKDFAHDVETTIKAFAEGRDVAAFGLLVQQGTITAAVAHALERHALSPERRARAAAALKSGSPGRMMAAGVNDVALIRELLEEARAGDGATPGEPLTPGNAAGGSAPFPLLGQQIDLGAEPPEFAYLFKGLPFAPGGKVNAIGGKPNAGKSPFAQLMLFAHCSGLEAGPFQPLRPGWGLYQDAETGLLAWRRWRRICLAYGVEPNVPGADFRDVDSLFSEAYCEQLEAYCRARIAEAKPGREAGLVVIDTYAAMLDAEIDQNSSQFAHWLRQLGKLSRALAVTIVVLIHNNKSSAGGGLEGIGGNIQAPGAMQGVIGLERTGDGNVAPIQVWCSRAPEHDFTPFKIRWEDVVKSEGLNGLKAAVVNESGAEPEAAGDAHKRMRCIRTMLTALERTPGQYATDIVKAAHGPGEREKRRIFEELVEAGVVVAQHVANKQDGNGASKAVMLYSLAPLSKAVVEARMKLGILS